MFIHNVRFIHKTVLCRSCVSPTHAVTPFQNILHNRRSTDATWRHGRRHFTIHIHRASSTFLVLIPKRLILSYLIRRIKTKKGFSFPSSLMSFSRNKKKLKKAKRFSPWLFCLSFSIWVTLKQAKLFLMTKFIKTTFSTEWHVVVVMGRNISNLKCRC